MSDRVRRVWPLALLLAALASACGGGSGPPRFRPNFFDADRAIDPTSPVTARSDSPQVCCDRNRVYAAWIDRRGPFDNRVLFTRSTNAGASFDPIPRRLDTDPLGFGGSDGLVMCCDGNRIYVAWLDTRDGLPDVRFNRSLDGGTTWLGADIRVNVNEAGTLTHAGLRMCCEGDRVHLAFVVVEDELLRVAVSFSAGTAFSGAPQVVHPPIALPAEPDICCDDGEVYVAWADFRDGFGDIYVNRSANGGSSWEPDGVRIDRGVAGVADSRRPRLCCTSRRVYAAWEDDRTGRTVWFNRSVDGARTWRSIDLRMDQAATPPAAVGGYDLCCERGEVYVAWTDTRSGAADLFVRRSTNLGLDFDPELRLDDGAPGGSASVRPQLCCDGPNVYAAWVEGSPENVRFTWSTNDGRTWNAPSLPMNTTADGVAMSAVPALCCSSVNVYVAWSDGREPPGRRIRMNASRP
ncbi:MAG: hypothetical protein QNJ98_07825 [Planctomycetota bacterium]|nr:hypothetical protein [Planctomycetota bacterium]